MKKNTVKVILSTLVAILIIAILTGMGGIQQLHKVKVQNQGIQENIVQQETPTKPSVEEIVTPSPKEKENVEQLEELNIAEPTTQPIDGINSDLSTSSPEINESKGDNYTSEDDPIYSSVYLVTLDTVERVNPETTVDEFIANLEVSEGNSIKIYKGEEEVTEGYIGTGMKVVGDNGREYKISVRGDITGEGIANQVELTMIIRHIVGQEGWNLEGINYSSGDITGDGKVDLVDVSKMINYIVYGTWEYEEVETPNAPTIVVITQKGEDGYYINKAEVKIVEDKSTNNSKTTYKITGTKEVAETQISEDEAIEIEGEGTYLITAYTYGIKGNRSKGNNQIIKIKEEKTAEYKETIYKMDVEGVYKKETTIKSGKVGEEVEISTTAPEGFTYDEEESKPKGTIEKDGSTELTVYFERNKYELNLSAGKGIDNVTGGGEYYYEKEIEIGAIEKAGYTFTEWTGDRTIKEKTTTVQIPVDGMSLTANATVNEYHIEYELNGGTLPDGQDEDDKYTVEEEHKLPTPEKPGYEFEGWTGDNGENPEKEVTIPEGTTGDKYYEANWRKMGYSIVVHHIEKGTNAQVAKDEEFIGKNGETYTITDLITNNGANERETINSDKYYYIEASGNTTGTYSEEIDGTEVTLYYGVHTFRISNSETEGGTISDIEETVRYGEDSTKEIVITPNKGNKVDTITVNETVIEFEEDVDTKIVKLPVFRNVTEDKVIKVTFIKIPVVAEITTCQIERLKGTQYETLREAIEAIENENLTAQDSQTTITMLANTQEGANAIIDKNIKIDLKGYTIKSSTESPTLTIQSGTLNIVDSSEEVGTIKNTKGTAVKVEQGATLTIGEDDEEVSQTSPKIEGINYGVDAQGTFNYYDGIIIGVIAINGDVADMPYLKNPSVTNEDGKQVAVLATILDVEATIGKKTFTQLELAIDYANKNTDEEQVEIVIVKELTKSDPIEIDNTKNIKLNLNGYTTNLRASITNKGQLEIVDTSETSTGIIKSDITIPIKNGGTLKLTSGTISTSGDSINNNVINNDVSGTIEVVGGIITSSKSYGINNNKGTIKVAGGTIISSKSSGINNKGGAVTIKSGTITGYHYGIYNDSQKDLIIEGGKISQTSPSDSDYSINSAVYNYTTGTVIITGGELIGETHAIYNNSTGIINTTNAVIKGDLRPAIYNKSAGKIIVNGGSITSTSHCGIYNCNYQAKTDEKTGKIEINGGTITGYNYGVYNAVSSKGDYKAGIITIKDATISNISSNSAIYNGAEGIITVEDSTVTGKGRGIDNYGTGIVTVIGTTTVIGQGTTGIRNDSNGSIILGEKDEKSSEELIVTGKNYGIYNTSGTLSFYDGKITGGINQSIRGEITDGEENYCVNIVANEDTTTETATLGQRTGVVQLNGVTYTSLKEAINQIETKGTINYIGNEIIEEDITVPNGKNITIDLKGYTIRQHAIIENSGTLIIKDSSESTTGAIEQNVNKSIINKAGGNLEIQGGTINANMTTSIINEAEGVLKITGGVITSTVSRSNSNCFKLIENNGEMKLSEGTITGTGDYTCGVYNQGEGIVDVTGGTISATKNYGYGIYNNSIGEIRIKEGIITGQDYGIYNDGAGTVKLIGGEVSGRYGISNVLGTITITKGTITGQVGMLNELGTVTIEGGTINATGGYGYAINNNSTGTITMTGGTVELNTTNTFSTSYVINNNSTGTIEIKGGEIIAAGGKNTDGIYNSEKGTITIGEKDQTVYTDTPVITGTRYGLNNPSGTFNFYDGIIIGNLNQSIYGAVTDQETGYDVIRETVDEIKEKATLQKTLPVAKLLSKDEQYYTINEAIKAVENEGETIQILRDANIIENIVIDESKNINLDLNGKTLNIGNKKIQNEGILTIKDDNEVQKGIIKSESNGESSNYFKLIENCGSVTIAEGTISTTGEYVCMICNTGTGAVTIKEGTISATGRKGYVIYNENTGAVTIEGGTISTTGSDGYEIYNKSTGTVTITGGTISTTGRKGYGIYNESTGTVTVTEGKIISSTYYGIYNNSTGAVTIEGGAITGGTYGIYNINGTVEITGGTITANGSDGYGQTTGIGVLNSNGILTITGGVITANGYTSSGASSSGIRNLGILTITEGTITSNDKGIYSNAGTIIITGGTITGSNYGIQTNDTGTITIGEKDKYVNTNTPSITGGKYGLYNPSGTFNFYDGVITGRLNQSIYGALTDQETGYDVIKETVESTKEKATLQRLPVAKLLVKNEQYYTINEALEAVESKGETIQILRDANITENIVIDENKNINLDLNGKSLNIGNSKIQNEGNLTIKDDSGEEQKGTITSTVNGASSNCFKLIENNGEMELAGGTIGSTGNYVEGIYNTKTLKITGGTVEVNGNNTYGIYSTGTVTMAEGNIKLSNGSGHTYGIYSTGTVTMTGGNIKSNYMSSYTYGIYNTGTLTIAGSKIETSLYSSKGYGYGIYNTGKVEFTEGMINVTREWSGNTYGIYNAKEGSIIVKGGTISTKENYQGYNGTGISNEETGTVEVQGGQITGTRYGINNSSTGTVTITEGTIISSNSYGINNNSKGTITLGEKDKSVHMDTPVIIGINYGLYNPSGTFNFYDGVITGETQALYGDTKDVEEGYELNITEDGKKATLKIADATVEAVVSVGSIYYNTLQQAIDSINEGTIKVHKEIALTEKVVIPRGKNITINLNDCIITYDSADEPVIEIETGATLTLVDNGEDETLKGKIQNNLGVAIDNKGTFNNHLSSDAIIGEVRGAN